MTTLSCQTAVEIDDALSHASALVALLQTYNFDVDDRVATGMGLTLNTIQEHLLAALGLLRPEPV